MMATIKIVFVLGIIFCLSVMVSSQHLSYGEKITTLSKLTDSVERSRLFSSPKNYEIVDAVDDVLRNWDRTLLRLAQNNRWAASGEVSPTCISHLNLTLAHVTETWALRMLDSIAKLPSGFFNGNLLWTGSYDECVNETAVIYLGQNSTNATYPFKGKYCRVGIPLAPPQPIAADIQEQAIRPGELALGLCMPSSCSQQDVSNLMNGALSVVPPYNNYTLKVEKTVCQQDKLEYDARAIGVIVMFSFLLALMVLGTCFDVFVVHKLHLYEEEPLRGKPGGLLQDEPEENESSNIKYRIRSNEQTPLLAGVSQRSIQEPEEQGTGNVV